MVRVLQRAPAGPPAATGPPLRRSGVYLVAGGAGGIGAVLCRHLAREAQARVAILGRRPPDERSAQLVADVEARGGRAIYLQADVAGSGQVCAAVDRVRAAFGRIDGAFHAALVLRDVALARMQDDDLRAVLAPKVAGAVAFGEALRGEPLDFLTFFSSALSFVDAAGQGNYAAASTFEDAYAAVLGERCPFPVSVVNWGYWGTVGAVAWSRYRERFEAEGVGSIEPREGMAALDLLLGRRTPQAVVIKAAPEALHRLGLERGEGSGAEPDAFDELDRLGRALLVRALVDDGALPRDGGRLPVAGLRTRLGVAAGRERLFDAVVDILLRSRAVRRDADDLVLDPAAVGDVDAAALPPELEPHVQLLERCVAALPAVLGGRTSATEILFPRGSVELVERVYRGHPATDLYHRLLAAELQAALARHASAADGGVVRVIELGAGTGAASVFALEACAAAGVPVQYAYTDVSLAFITRGEARFGARYPFASFALLDLDEDPEKQGFERYAADVVLATNVLHATRRIEQSLAHVKALLRPGGLLLLDEVTHRSDFVTLTFGLTDGWWSFEDPELRLPHAPLLSPPAWQRVLRASGFDGVRVRGVEDGPPEDLDQCVLRAVSPGRDRPAASDQAAREYVRDVFAEVLRYGRRRLGDRTTFEHFGIDSIVGLNLLARFEDDLGPLPSTLLFEHPTIERLAAFLAADRPGELAGRVAPEAAPDARPETPEEPPAGEGIAIVGVVGRYPGAPDLDAFWRLLAEGRSAIGEVPRQRWDWRAHRSEDRGRTGAAHGRWGAFLDGVDQFDAGIFGILPKDADVMDPQERLFLEAAWELVEQTGYAGRHPDDPVTGVFVGTMYGAYGELGAAARATGTPNGAQSCRWSIANRVSYVLDLHGPSLAVDSACSSSLLAVHLACESIRRGECGMALAGGVNLILDPGHFAALAALNMLSPDGRCKVFDASADGFVPGEGVGAVLLKPLSAAERDGDRIWGVVLAGATNAGGKTGGYTVPNPDAQAGLVAEAIRRAGVEPDAIGYVEAHGTGTSLGDPIELVALRRALDGARGRGGMDCAVGSVKANVGHLEGAAGIAGLTKVLLQIRHGRIVPCANLESLNPKIDLGGSRLVLPSSLSPWPQATVEVNGHRRTRPRLAGISSFGAGGANVHLLVEEHPRGAPRPPQAEGDQVLLLSAPSRERLADAAAATAGFLERPPEDVTWADVAYTSQVGRWTFDERLAVVAADPMTAASALRAFVRGEPAPGLTAGTAAADAEAVDLVDLASAARAWIAGAPVDWRRRWSGRRPRRVAFPGVPLRRRRHWLPAAAPDASLPAAYPAPAAGRAPDEVVGFERTVWEPVAVGPMDLPVRSVVLTAHAPALDAAVRKRLRRHGIDVCASAADADAVMHVCMRGDLEGDVTQPFQFLLAQGVEVLRHRPLRMLCARATGDDQPHLAALSGLVRTLALEARGSSGVCVALERDTTDVVADRLVDELLGSRDADVAYRDGRRLVARQEQMEPPPAVAWTAQDGWYLVTGGAGRLGLHVAGLLTRRGARHVVLCGRSELPDAITPGTRYECADVTVAGDVERLVVRLRDELGPLRGVVHAAGVLRDRRAVDKTAAEAAEVLAPKLTGTLNLDRETAGEPLGFFVLFSSIVGRTGNPGQADYAYANAFLDAFAHTRERWRADGRRRGRTLSVGWALWRDGGMTVAPAALERIEQRHGMVPMSTEAGLIALERLLASDEPAVAVAASRAVPAGPAPAPQAPPRDMLAELRAIASHYLLVDPGEVDVHAQLLDLGFDSISMTDLIGEVNESHGLDLLPTVLFECPTLADLADRLTATAPSRAAAAPRAPSPAAPPAPSPAPARTGSEIAIVGASAVLPGAPDLDAFWRRLVAGADLVRQVGEDRQELRADPRTREVLAGFLDDVAAFDAERFRIAPAEAALMDPQQRIFLQVAWQAVADAGYRHTDLAGTPTGMFVGVSTSDYDDLLTRSGVAQKAHVATGLSHAVLANRVSHLLDLRGPSEAVDTACSSSLVAIHRAVRSLRARECDAALAGGVNVLLTPGLFVAFAEGGMLSPRGRCRTFDAGADGYVRGEGAGAVLLKRLEDALADGDHVHGVIRGSAVNHGGRAASLTAPNPRAQAEVMRAACADAEVKPDTITYVEAHGTGTPLGDAVEIAAIKEVFGEGTGTTVLGSVKTNVGHLEAAAGIAGLMKVLLALRHGETPPHLHLDEPNPHLRLDGTRLEISTERRPWAARGPRRAGISSFGFGGTNAHVVLEEAPAPAETGAVGPRVLTLSAPDPDRLRAYACELADRLDSLDLDRVCYTLQAGREQHRHRLAVVADQVDDVAAALRSAAPSLGIHRGDATAVRADPGDVEPAALAAAWVGGAAVDWSGRWSRPPGRVPLPTFAPAPTRFWFDELPPAEPEPPQGSRWRATVHRHLAEVLGVTTPIASDRPFSALGLDSMYAMEIARRLSADAGREISPSALYEHDTVDGLARFLEADTSDGDALHAVLEAAVGRRLDRSRSFTDSGLGSLDMLRAVSALEQQLGGLPKTLLFDHPTLDDLTRHLCDTHGADAVAVLRPPAAEAPPARVSVRDPARVLAKVELEGSPLAGAVAELMRRHPVESGLAGRDIAPLLFVARSRQGVLEFARDERRALVWAYVGPDECHQEVVEEFAAYALESGLEVNVLSASRLERVGGRSFTATPFGVVQQLDDLAGFTLAGKPMARLRGMINRFAKAGDIHVREYASGSDPQTDEAVAELVDRWASTRTAVNPYVYTVRDLLRRGRLPAGHRIFLTSVDAELVAAVVLSPMGGEGYLLDLEFYPPDMPLGGLEHTIVQIIETLRREGVGLLSFGATFGVKVCDSPNASQAAERALEELRGGGVLGAGNYQFKRKFRPTKMPIYLCQPAEGATDAAQVLLMIASPSAPQPARARTAVDLVTDSWSERDDEFVAEWRRRIQERLEVMSGCPDAVAQPWLPFPLVVATPSGRAAEALLCRLWPGRRGVVLHNGLFPTWLGSAAERGLRPVAVEHPKGHGGDVPLGALERALEDHRGELAFVAIEPGSNASGGRPLTLANLVAVRERSAAAGVPLVLDATRIVTNAVASAAEDPWATVRAMLELADAATLSLSKDFGVDFGGLVCARAPELVDRLAEHRRTVGADVSRSARRHLQFALSDHDTVLSLVRRRVDSVAALGELLASVNIATLGPPGGHCVLLDGCDAPETVVERLVERAGVRCARHLGGSGARRDLDRAVRLAVPLGMSVEDAVAAGERIVGALAPEWFDAQLRGLKRRYRDTRYRPADENLAVLREAGVDVVARLVETPEGEVEVLRAGAGPPLVLMHPFNIGAGMFAAQFAGLTDAYDVVVAHQPGVGRTAVESELGLPAMARLERDVLQRLGVRGPFHVGGASVGAILAQSFALTYPSETASLILLGGSYKFANRKGQIDALDEVIAEDFALIRAGNPSSPALRDEAAVTARLLRCESMDPRVGLRYLEMFAADPGLVPRLGEIQAPTLVVHGRHDSVVGVKTGHFLHGAIPDADYVELADSGHFVCLTDGHAVNAALRAFLAGLSRTS